MDEHRVGCVHIHWEWLFSLNFQDQDPKYTSLIIQESQIHQKAAAVPKNFAETADEQVGKLVLVLHEQWLHRSCPISVHF